ncbi:hypothetical protein DFQ28_002341 [Apophysomyces sp. BC1034]|nr:hypothetical protein DFQ30_001021 [Apophysomyces sp. BC1015]KAG0183149.1 hypothetical protein DFQ29_009847 [Apophysomyces sp. BC1021]KAG0193977.1 hypothetical protein DFQ28_002341 [Apophysomyces sp. BC1034]
MGPVLVLAVIVGVPLGVYGGYLSYQWLCGWLQERQERKEYEEYVRQTTEKYHGSMSPPYECDEIDDEEPLAHSVLRATTGQNHLRNRRSYAQTQTDHADYELTELQQSIMDRKRNLQLEQERLEEAEEDLRRRHEYLKSRGNNILGVFDDEPRDPFDDFSFTATKISHHPPVLENPFDDSKRMDMATAGGSGIATETNSNLAVAAPIGKNDVSQEIESLLPSFKADLSDSEESWDALGKVESTQHRNRMQSDSSDISFLVAGSDKSGSNFGIASMSEEDEHR